MSDSKRCTRCKKTKQLGEFRFTNGYHTARCKTCLNEGQRKHTKDGRTMSPVERVFLLGVEA